MACIKAKKSSTWIAVQLSATRLISDPRPVSPGYMPSPRSSCSWPASSCRYYLLELLPGRGTHPGREDVSERAVGIADIKLPRHWPGYASIVGWNYILNRRETYTRYPEPHLAHETKPAGRIVSQCHETETTGKPVVPVLHPPPHRCA